MEFIFHLIITVCSWIPIVLSFSFLFGRGKVMHFGAVGVSVAAGYGLFLTVLATGSYLLGIAVGLLVASLVSSFFAWLSFRLDSDGLGVMSIAVHLGILSIILNWTSLTRGALGLPRIPRLAFLESQGHLALAASLVAIAWILLFLWISRSSLGRQMSALAEQEWNAKALGINRIRVHWIAFLLLGATTVSDNFFFGQQLRLYHPNDGQFPAFVFLMTLMVAGGPGRVWGAVLSSVTLVLLREGLRFLPLLIPIPVQILGPLQLLFFGGILLGAVYLQRDTLFPQKRTI